MVFYRIVKRIPGGDASKVFFGTSLLLFIACAPRAYKETRRGHEFFSAERPEAVDESMRAKEKDKYAKIVADNVDKPAAE
mmetsp:Transcript_16800/g.50974  ORF Transcript_16800/g.50974 Transcript_16800/m.50974 type:complete len:80 (-) Transcript_16800:820-1059(-)